MKIETTIILMIKSQVFFQKVVSEKNHMCMTMIVHFSTLLLSDDILTGKKQQQQFPGPPPGPAGYLMWL
jgi:hypothetical protein